MDLNITANSYLITATECAINRCHSEMKSLEKMINSEDTVLQRHVAYWEELHKEHKEAVEQLRTVLKSLMTQKYLKTY